MAHFTVKSGHPVVQTLLTAGREAFSFEVVSVTETRAVLRETESGLRFAFSGKGFVDAANPKGIGGTADDLEILDAAGASLAVLSTNTAMLKDWLDWLGTEGAQVPSFFFSHREPWTVALEVASDLDLNESFYRAWTAYDIGLKVEGSPGNDRIAGGRAVSSLDGGAGDDTIIGSTLGDWISGGPGDDLIRPVNLGWQDTVAFGNGSGHDTVQLEGGPDASWLDFGIARLGRSDWASFTVDAPHDVIRAVAEDGSTLTVLRGTAEGGNGVKLSLGDSGKLDLTLGAGDEIKFTTVVSFTAHSGSSPESKIILDNSDNAPLRDFGPVLDLNNVTAANGAKIVVTGFEGVIEVNDALNDNAMTLIGTGGREIFHADPEDTVHGGGGYDVLKGRGYRWLNFDAARISPESEVTGIEAFDGDVEMLFGKTGTGMVLKSTVPSYASLPRSVVAADGVALRAIEGAESIQHLYRVGLARTPEIARHKLWAERLYLEGAEEVQMQLAYTILKSPEFRARFGTLDFDALMDRLTLNALGRLPTEEERAVYQERKAALESTGASEQEIHAKLLLEIATLPQVEAQLAEAVETRLEATIAASWTDEVYGLYQATFGRDPDVPGLVNWASQLAEGKTLAQVAYGFVESAEFLAQNGRPLSAADFVANLYHTALERAPDLEGFAAWTGALESGALSCAEVLMRFVQSAEFAGRAEPDLTAWAERATGEIGSTLSGATMIGGLGVDTFVFVPKQNVELEVWNLEAWDKITFEEVSFTSAESFSGALTVTGDDVVLTEGALHVTFHDTTPEIVEATAAHLFA